MACQPRHPFFKYVIDTLKNRMIKTDSLSLEVMETTGPFMVVKAYEEYSSNHDDPPQLVDAELFTPTVDPRRKDSFKNYCDSLKSKGIKNLTLAQKICVSFLKGDEVTEKSLTVHHGTHSWVPRFKAGINKATKFDINVLRKTKDAIQIK